MKNRLVRNLATLGLFLSLMFSLQILGLNNQTSNAMINEDRPGQSVDGAPPQKTVKIRKNLAKNYISRNGEVKIDPGTTIVYIDKDAFNGNEHIKSIVFPESVKKIVFDERCLTGSSIEKLELPQHLEEIIFKQSSFYKTNKIKSIVFPDSVKQIVFSAFSFSESSINTIVPSKNLDNLILGVSCFQNTKSLQEFDLSQTKLKKI